MTREPSGARARIDRALRTMEGQHVRLHELHAELDRALERGGASGVHEWLGRLQSALRAHFELEESAVFPALADLDQSASDGVHKLAGEHREVLSSLEGLLAKPRESVAASLPELRRVLAAHESDEERIVRSVLDGKPPGGR